ncbi:threonine aldolase family protein [Citreimonas sp.]|uniref:threonine aldolase family protein n=1 Tax=Citreimonas sp. TaxID=3036715 RepID=UPI0040596425
MHFASDNSGPAHASVLEALAEANDGYAMGYGTDALSIEVRDGLRALFEAPEAEVFLVPTGTAANSLALACLCEPYRSIFCAELAHIHVDECNAPEFYTGGAKLWPVPHGDRMTPDTLRAAIDASKANGIHGPVGGAVSITSVTEGGNVLTIDEIAALSAVAKEAGLPLHLDGARFANACVKLGCTPAEMSWKAGVDVAVFGGTKNGLLGAEAVIFFDPALARGFAERRKRGGHLFSKHRMLAAQMKAYLADDLWFELAKRANAACDMMRAGFEAQDVKIGNETHANMLFAHLPARVHDALKAEGAVYHTFAEEDGLIPGRFVCDWSTGQGAVDALLAAMKRHL